MKTTWIDLHKVLLETNSQLTQQYAQGVQNAVEIGASDTTNVTDWVYIPLTLERINFLRIGYQYLRHRTDCRSKITKVALYKMAAPGEPPPLLYSEDVCLNNVSYAFCTFPRIKAADPCKGFDNPALETCQDEPFDPDAQKKASLPSFFSPEGFYLGLQINFVDNRDRFVIGPVGIEDHTPTLAAVRPLDFGAVGDGITDDSRALQESVAYAQANRLPLDLTFRKYAFSETLLIQPPQLNEEGFTLRNGTLHYTSQTGAAVRVDKGGNFTPLQMDNVTIQGKSDVGLDLGRAGNSTFRRLSIQGGFRVGLALRGSMFNTFYDCQFLDNGINVQITAYQPGAKVSNDNKFWNCMLKNAVGTATLDISSAANNAFYACDFEEWKHRAVTIDQAHGTSFIDCRFECSELFFDLTQPHPWTMIWIGVGDSTRIIGCWVPSAPRQSPEDVLIRVVDNLKNDGVRIIGTVFGTPGNIVSPDSGFAAPNIDTESYGNYHLGNKFNNP